jgi:hypothetical protein
MLRRWEEEERKSCLNVHRSAADRDKSWEVTKTVCKRW